MINKFKLLFNTVRYLKPIQVCYQIYYRVKPKRNLNYYISEDFSFDMFNLISFNPSFTISTYVHENGTFNFLNLSKQFLERVNWNDQEYGKLWNYNLQYLNYLNQKDLNDKAKIQWLLEIIESLNNGELKLEPYPVSLRVMSTIRYCVLNKVRIPDVLISTHAQLKYLNSNLEFHLLGNHLLENAFALMMGGYVFNEVQWISKAKKILSKELEEQILDDGGHFELSPMYHQIILFRMLELIEWYHKSDCADSEFLDFIRNKARMMLSWLKSMTFKNGDIPHFNDSTIDIALSSEELFMFGAKLGLVDIERAILSGSGYRDFNLGEYECLVDVGSIGPSYQPGHGHSDALSFVLYYQAKPFIVDTGTSTYQIGLKRSLERSTAAHNTVMIGERNQSEVWGGFRVGKRAPVHIYVCEEAVLRASHSGYLSNFGVIHKRSFQFNEKEIKIIDEIGNQNGKFYLHFHPDCIVDRTGENSIQLSGIGQIVLEGSFDLSLIMYEYAHGYNTYLEATALVVSFRGTLKTSINFNA